MGKARRKDKDQSSVSSEEPKLYLEEAVLERKLPEIDLRVLVDLPAGLDYNEWLASHTIAFFDHINLVYGTISEFCTMSGCPDMTGPQLRTYLWFDEKGKKTRVAAPQYIDYVMTFTQKTITDESIFPTKYANEFPSSFESIVRKILRLLFHVLAHLYHTHFREVVLLNLHAHLNCLFAHMDHQQMVCSVVMGWLEEHGDGTPRVASIHERDRTPVVVTWLGYNSTNINIITKENSHNILVLFDERFSLIDPSETAVLSDLVAALKILGPDTPANATSSPPDPPPPASEQEDPPPLPLASSSATGQ